MMCKGVLAIFVVGLQGAAATAATKAQIAKTTNHYIIDAGTAAACTLVTSNTADQYGNAAMQALAEKFATKLNKGLTADNIIMTPACAGKDLTIQITFYIPKDNSEDGAGIKTAVNALTTTELKKIADDAYGSISGMTAPTTTVGAQIVVGTEEDAQGKAFDVQQTVVVTYKAGQQAKCTEAVSDPAGKNVFKSAVTTVLTFADVTDITFDPAPACPTADPAIATITYKVHQKSSDKGSNTILAKMTGGNAWKGTDATTNPSLWKSLEAADPTAADDVAGVAITQIGGADAKQTDAADKVITGDVSLTLTDYAECDKLKGPLAMTQIKSYIKSKTSSLMGNIVATVVCSDAGVGTLHIEVTSPTLNGNTLSADVVTKLGAITTWGADIKTQVNYLKDITLAKCEKTGAVTFTAADIVTTQTKAQRVSGSVKYTAHNRADCEDIKSRHAEILTDINTKSGAATNTKSSVTVGCIDKAVTMDYSLLTDKDVTGTKQGVHVLNKLNGMDSDAWKGVITAALAAGTAITLDGTLATTKIIGATIADTTTTAAPTTAAATTAPAYVPMTKIAGVFQMTVDESGCLNMKDASVKLGDLMKTESKAPTTASATVTTDCTTLSAVTMSYEIVTPTSGSPTPATMVTNLKAVSTADYMTKIKAAVKNAGTNPTWTEPTITGLTVKTEPAATAVTTTMGPTTSFTGSTTKGTKKEIKGKLVFKVASSADCDKIKAQNGKDAIINMLHTTSGIAKSNIAVTVTCTAARRLSDGRRLSKYNVDVAYTITVPATSTVAASTVETSLKAVDNAGWKTKMETALANAATAITVTIEDMTKTDPTTTTIHDVSSAMTWTTTVGLLLVARFLF